MFRRKKNLKGKCRNKVKITRQQNIRFSHLFVAAAVVIVLFIYSVKRCITTLFGHNNNNVRVQYSLGTVCVCNIKIKTVF